jgi:cell division protein FtsB
VIRGLLGSGSGDTVTERITRMPPDSRACVRESSAMSRSGTTSIKRPANPPAADEGSSRLGDPSRSIAIDKRILRRPRLAIGAGIGALAVIGAIAAAVFILPIQTWFDQNDSLDQRQAQLDELQRVNGQLAGEVEWLETEDGAREAAREELGVVEIGERRSSFLPLPALSGNLPDGWPYNVVTRIIDARTAGSAPAAGG